MSHISDELYVTDEKGKKYLVQVWRQSLNTSNLSGASSLQGMPHYKLKDGSILNTDDGKTFIHYRTNERFIKVS
jgi:hypothetical protein